MRPLVWCLSHHSGGLLRCEELGLLSEHRRLTVPWLSLAAQVLRHDSGLGVADQHLPQEEREAFDAAGGRVVGAHLLGRHTATRHVP